MNTADEQYLAMVENILAHGDYDQNRTGIPTYKLPHQRMQFDLETEFPILTTKLMGFKTAVRELLWIYRDQSNDVGLLQAQNVHIWDEWADETNSIGKAYGYQVAKYKQLDRLLHTLKTNPQDRGMLMDLWNFDDLAEMRLRPCAFLTMWDVSDGRLNLMLIQRSGDMGLGVPFNMTQYAVLAHLIAQVTGLRPGLFTHEINNAHIYENHVEALRTQLTRRDTAFDAPTLVLNPAVTNFYDFSIEDIKLEGYQHHGKLEMEVAV
jgi:thymidylate synthase